MLGDLFDIGSVGAWPTHSGHRRFSGVEGADACSLRVLDHEEKACREIDELITNLAISGDCIQLTISPNRTPMTKSHTVMHIMMLAIVIYSVLKYGQGDVKESKEKGIRTG